MLKHDAKEAGRGEGDPCRKYAKPWSRKQFRTFPKGKK